MITIFYIVCVLFVATLARSTRYQQRAYSVGVRARTYIHSKRMGR